MTCDDSASALPDTTLLDLHVIPLGEASPDVIAGTMAAVSSSWLVRSPDGTPASDATLGLRLHR
jgi:hypothetical protein